MLNEINAIFQILLLLLFGFPMIYLCVLSFSALAMKRRYRPPKAVHTRSFALLIPAHNEEKVISSLMEDLKKLDYPSDHYEVFVVADNCSDKTARIVKDYGNVVFQRFDPQNRGKGFALKWGMKQILSNDKKYDAVIILDADVHVYPNLIQVMNAHLEHGANVVQGYVSLKPEPDEWSSEATRFGRTLNNYVRALGRKYLRFPTSLKGIGMCFSKEVLKNNPWKAYSLTEDLEYGLQLLLKDIDIIFAPENIGYAVSPHDPKNAESQRERWELGRYPLIHRYTGTLLRAYFKKRSWKYLDALIDLMTPPLVNFMGYIGILLTMNIALYSFGFSSSGYMAIAWFVLILLGFLHVQTGLIVAQDRSLYRVFAYVPRYALWKIKIYLRVLFKGREKKWVRTVRD